MTCIPLVYIFPDQIGDVGILMNLLFLLLVLGLGITMTVEGFKVLRMVKELYPASATPTNSSLVLRALTKLIVGSSCSLIITAIVLLITALIFIFPSGEYRTDNCMGVMVAYRTLELGIMTLIAIPLRRYEDTSSSKSSQPATRLASTGVIE